MLDYDECKRTASDDASPTGEQQSTSAPESQEKSGAASAASYGSAAGPHVAKGVCIVCGSAMVLAFWRGHPDNHKVHCNDCGSEVTEWMHRKKQPNDAGERGRQHET